LQLLWEEYGATHPDGYRYSQFCHHYQQWKRCALPFMSSSRYVPTLPW
jgi:transposase